MKSTPKIFAVLILVFISILQGCAMGPTKEQKREMAFNLVFNTITVKTAATVYSVANIFSFGANTVLENFDAIAESDKDKAKAFTELSEKMPENLMKTVAKLRPKAREIIFKKPEYLDKFVDTAIYRQGVNIAQKAHRFGLPDLTRELDDEQIALWMQAFMSSKDKVKNIADPLSDWSKEALQFFEINLDPKSWI